MKAVGTVRAAVRASTLSVGLSVLGALSGCGVMPDTQPSDPQALPLVTATQTVSDSMDYGTAERMPLAVLILQRQQLCLIPTTERLQLLDAYRSVFVKGAATLESLPARLPEPIHQLNALILASCDPARTPGILSEMLAVVTEEDWPAEYMAFFDMLVSSHRAYAIVEDRRGKLQDEHRALQVKYQELAKQYQALREEHEKTIEGISDIERGIDLPQADELGL